MTRTLPVIAAFLTLILMPGSVRGQDEDLATLLSRISASMGSEVAFREEHHGALYEKPAIYLGRLVYRNEDGALVKEITSPEAARLTVSDRNVIVETGERRRRLSLRGRPELQAMAGGFRALLEGDMAPLEGLFDASLERRDDDRWSITLAPINRRLEREVEHVIIDGQAARVEGICTRLVNGDWQYMTLLHDG